MLTLYSLEAIADGMCMIVTLLDPFLFCSRDETITIMFADSDNSEDKKEESVPNDGEQTQGSSSQLYSIFLKKLRPYWDFLLKLYPSLFREEYTMTSTENRYLLFWLACISMVRLFTVFQPTLILFILMSVLYIFQYLVFEYEGFTAKTMHPRKARIMSISSAVMSVLTIFLTLWLD